MAKDTAHLTPVARCQIKPCGGRFHGHTPDIRD